MFKRWMRNEPYRRRDGRWVPVLQVWEETPSGAVERLRLVGATDCTVASEAEAQVLGAAWGRHWLLSRCECYPRPTAPVSERMSYCPGHAPKHTRGPACWG